MTPYAYCHALGYYGSTSSWDINKIVGGQRTLNQEPHSFFWGPSLPPVLNALTEPSLAKSDTVLDLSEADYPYVTPMLEGIDLRVRVPAEHSVQSSYSDAKWRWTLWAPESEFHEKIEKIPYQRDSIVREVWHHCRTLRPLPRELAISLLRRESNTVAYRGNKKYVNNFILYLCTQVPDVAPSLLPKGSAELEILPLLYDDATDTEVAMAIKYLALRAGKHGRRAVGSFRNWIKPIRLSAIYSSRYRQLPDILKSLGPIALYRLLGKERDGYSAWLFKFPFLDSKIQDYLPPAEIPTLHYDFHLIRIGAQYALNHLLPVGSPGLGVKEAAAVFERIYKGLEPPPQSFVEACGEISPELVAYATDMYLSTRITA